MFDPLSIYKLKPFSLPTKFGEFTGIGYDFGDPIQPTIALVMGDISSGQDVLVRMHSECLTGDALGSIRCDCGAQRDDALAAIAETGRGIFLYLRQEGRGIGLANKLRAYALQDVGADTVDANIALGFADDQRDYEFAAWVLQDLGVKSVRLLTNNPQKVAGLEKYGISVSGRVAIQTHPTAFNQFYMQTKQIRMGHLFQFPTS